MRQWSIDVRWPDTKKLEGGDDKSSRGMSQKSLSSFLIRKEAALYKEGSSSSRERRTFDYKTLASYLLYSTPKH
jgi:hypothetical protein